MSVSIKIAEHSDIDALNRLYKLLHPMELKCEDTPIKEVRYADIENYPLIIQEDSETVGFLLLLVISYWNFKYASIEELYVHAEFRNRGYASKLLDKAVEICKKEAVSVVSVETDKSNIPAMNLYEKYGFEDDSEGSFVKYFNKKLDD